MDTVILTGRLTLEELKHDKPAEHEELVASGGLEQVEEELVGPVRPSWEKAFRIFGFAALWIGLTLITLICYAMIFGYQ